MTDRIAEVRDRIKEAVQADPPLNLTGGVVTAWVVVSEWMTPDGDLWLCRTSSEGLTAWQRDGMLSHGIEDAWEEAEERDG